MVDDKEHLFDKDEYQKQIKKEMAKLNSQQFANAGPAALGPEVINASLRSNLLPISTQFEGVGVAVQDYGTIGFVSQNIDFDLLGSTYNVFDINGDVTFGFDNMPLNRSFLFSVDIEISTMTPPVITWPATVKNLPPSLPTADGSRYILYFLGYRDDDEERYEVIGGFGGGGSGGSNIIFQDDSKVEVLDDGVAEGKVEVTTDGALLMRIGLVSGQKTINIQDSEITAFNVLRPTGSNKAIDSVSAGWNYETPNTTAHTFRVHNGTIFVDVGHFDAGGLNMDDLNISNVSGINFSNTGVSINDALSDMNFGVPTDQEFIFTSGAGIVLRTGTLSAVKTIDLVSSEIINFNVLRSGTNKAIDSISGGYSFDTPNTTEFNFRVRNVGDTAFINVGTFDEGGFKAEGLPIAEIFSIAFTNAGNAISQTATDFTLGTPSGSTFQLKIAGVAELTLSNATLGLVGNDIGQAGRVQLNEIATPASPAANTLFVYGKLDSGFTKLFYKQEDGTEVGPLGAGGAGFPVADNVFEVQDNVTPSKTHVWSLENMTASTTITFSSLQTASRSHTFPNATGTLATLANISQTFQGNLIFNEDVTIGSASGDDLVVTSRLASDFIPKTNNTFDLGSPTLGFAKAVIRNRLIIPVGTDMFD